MSIEIPADWTFRSEQVAAGFDAHVREQLPWYDLATKAVAHIGRHYIPRNGLVYDVGASTGNLYAAMRDTLVSRNARYIGIEESREMLDRWQVVPGNEHMELVQGDALAYKYEPYDFGVAFLTMMFFSVAERKEWLQNMIKLLRPGGAFVLVDKVVTPSGYVGTALRRMAMQWKRDSGTNSEQIIDKELSLAGFQRPINPNIFYGQGQCFFWFGEFAGWVFERNE